MSNHPPSQQHDALPDGCAALILACDPGLKGAIANYDIGRKILDVIAMPITTRQLSTGKLRDLVDEDELISLMTLFAGQGYTHLFLEQVGGMPGQGAHASFMFGSYVAAVRVAAKAAGIVVIEVPPAVWKAVMRAPKLKAAARHRATELMPALKHLWPLVGDDGKAEACLLALYGERRMRAA